MSEQIGVVLVFLGLFLSTLGLPWLAVRGLGILLGRHAGDPRRLRRLLAPAAVLAAGLVLGATPFAAQRASFAIFGLGERERLIDGKRVLTLTGWDRGDYSILSRKTDVAVLEMGNPDVTDETLLLLEPLTELEELTLNDTSVTDRGLSTLSKLPALESLRIARTKVTPEGVAGFLATPPPKLRQIDVSGNGIPVAVLRAWKDAARKDAGSSDASQAASSTASQGGRRYVH